MCQPGKWRLGLLPLLALWIGLNFYETERVEADLAALADLASSEATEVMGASTGAGRDIILKGAIFDSATRAAAVAAVRAVPGVRQIRDELAPPPSIAPYVWRASRDQDALTLSGAVDRPETRVALFEAAQKVAPRARIVDQMTYFSGEPAGFKDKAAGALAILAHLTSGQVELSGAELSAAGLAVSDAEAEAAKAEASRMAGVKLVKADLSGPKSAEPSEMSVVSPYVFSARWSEKFIGLEGYYPDEDAHAKILARARAGFSALILRDRMQRGAGAPKNFVDAALAGLDQLARLKSGDLALRDEAASLSGEAAGAEAADEIKAAFVAGQPGGYGVETHLTGAARDPGEAPASPARNVWSCQPGLLDMARKTSIQFEYGSAVIPSDATGALDALAAAARKCPQISLEVSGHADDVGRFERNKLISRRRAQKVVDYLIRAGVAADRLSMRANGESQPLAPNDSEDNRAKNRRIEFNVK